MRDKTYEAAFSNAWDTLSPEQRTEVADPPVDGVTDATFQRLIVKDGPPIVPLVGFTESERGPSRYVDSAFANYVRDRLARDEEADDGNSGHD